jgi:hypothetical protein
MVIEHGADGLVPGGVRFVVRNAAGDLAITHGVAEFSAEPS